MCLEWLFGGGNDDAEQAQAAALAAQTAAANQALLAQKQAADQAKAAADTESENIRQTKEGRMRRILAGGPFGATSGTDFGPAMVATRQLYGD